MLLDRLLERRFQGRHQHAEDIGPDRCVDGGGLAAQQKRLAAKLYGDRVEVLGAHGIDLVAAVPAEAVGAQHTPHLLADRRSHHALDQTWRAREKRIAEPRPVPLLDPPAVDQDPVGALLRHAREGVADRALGGPQPLVEVDVVFPLEVPADDLGIADRLSVVHDRWQLSLWTPAGIADEFALIGEARHLEQDLDLDAERARVRQPEHPRELNELDHQRSSSACRSHLLAHKEKGGAPPRPRSENSAAQSAFRIASALETSNAPGFSTLSVLTMPSWATSA